MSTSNHNSSCARSLTGNSLSIEARPLVANRAKAYCRDIGNYITTLTLQIIANSPSYKPFFIISPISRVYTGYWPRNVMADRVILVSGLEFGFCNRMSVSIES
jgi:hypothetical protein